MGEFKDHFIVTMDNVAPELTTRESILTQRSFSSSEISTESCNNTVNLGIGSSMQRMMKRLQQLDPELHNDLVKTLTESFYHFNII